jgi:RNAse (barnase) inhibitor barstar
MKSVEFMIVAEMLGALIEILGEKKVFTDAEYEKIKKTMTNAHDPKDTLDALEDILMAIRKAKIGEKHE